MASATPKSSTISIPGFPVVESDFSEARLIRPTSETVGNLNTLLSAVVSAGPGARVNMRDYRRCSHRAGPVDGAAETATTCTRSWFVHKGVCGPLQLVAPLVTGVGG